MMIIEKDSDTEEKRAVVAEIFSSIKQEISAETGVAFATLSEPVLFAIIRQLPSGGRPSLVFSCSTSLTSTEVLCCYAKGSMDEAEESTSLMCLSVSDLFSDHPRVPTSTMTPACRACLEVWAKVHSLVKN